MFGTGLEDQALVAGQLAVLHVLHLPFTCKTEVEHASKGEYSLDKCLNGAEPRVIFIGH